MRVLFLVAAITIGLLILATLVQVARAETVLERLLNSALAAANALVLLILIGFVFERPNYFGDIGLAYALLAFLFPLAFAKYLEAEQHRRAGNDPTPPTSAPRAGAEATEEGTT